MAVHITSHKGDAVLLSKVGFDTLEATVHVLRVPAFAKRLLASLQHASAGSYLELDRAE